MSGMRPAIAVLLLLAWLPVVNAEEPLRIDAATYRDKCAGAWAGQMLGASYGARRSAPWQPSHILDGTQQQELSIETVFLQALLDHGPAITPKEAGMAFARSKYELSGANVFGRENVRLGIMPPRSGDAKHTLHGDEIDFQREADLFGIVSPGMPGESSRLCRTFGGIMCNEDGVYGGMFVAGMYAAAFLHDDVRAVVEAGLACIPKNSRYHACISDVFAWHDETPDNWQAVQANVQLKWSSQSPKDNGGRPDPSAQLNGAYATLALLCGNGDMARTLDIAVRCGQYAGSNASTAAGVLGCMRGFNALVPDWSPTFAEIENKPFFASDFTLGSAVAASQSIAGQVVRRAGGEVKDGTFVIRSRIPAAPNSNR